MRTAGFLAWGCMTRYRISVHLHGCSTTWTESSGRRLRPLIAITGSIAEGFYGTPEELEKECMNRLPDDLREIVEQFRKVVRGSK